MTLRNHYSWRCHVEHYGHSVVCAQTPRIRIVNRALPPPPSPPPLHRQQFASEMWQSVLMAFPGLEQRARSLALRTQNIYILYTIFGCVMLGPVSAGCNPAPCAACCFHARSLSHISIEYDDEWFDARIQYHIIKSIDAYSIKHLFIRSRRATVSWRARAQCRRVRCARVRAGIA